MIVHQTHTNLMAPFCPVGQLHSSPVSRLLHPIQPLMAQSVLSSAQPNANANSQVSFVVSTIRMSWMYLTCSSSFVSLPTHHPFPSSHRRLLKEYREVLKGRAAAAQAPTTKQDIALFPPVTTTNGENEGAGDMMVHCLSRFLTPS